MRTKKYWEEEIGKDWTSVLKDTLRSPYMDKLMNFVHQEYIFSKVFPTNSSDLFLAFRLCPWDKVKVVIIGEEPNNIIGQSALAFGDSLIHSYHNPSVIAIEQCIAEQYHTWGTNLNFDFTLQEWAKQGILLLNQSITNRMQEQGSHIRPWNKFIKDIIKQFNYYKPGTIFFLWGDKVKETFMPLLIEHHHVYDWEHPYDAFMRHKQWNCPNFKQADKMLEYLYGKEEKINW